MEPAQKRFLPGWMDMTMAWDEDHHATAAEIDAYLNTNIIPDINGVGSLYTVGQEVSASYQYVDNERICSHPRFLVDNASQVAQVAVFDPVTTITFVVPILISLEWNKKPIW